MKEIEFYAGCHIAKAAKLLLDAAKSNGEAVGMFNNIQLVAREGQTEADVVGDYQRQSEALAELYRNSPEGRAAATEREESRAAAQAKHDRLMRQLPSLNFRDDAAVLDWCCQMQEPSDHVGVIVRRETIVETFAKHGFEPGVNCGADYKPRDRGNMFRYLVGQALSGLQDGPAIHSIIHQFADEWRAKFLPSIPT